MKNRNTNGFSRRDTLALAASMAMATEAHAQTPTLPVTKPMRREKPYLGLVSRHLQWTTADHGIEVAKQAGFPAIIWTVRPGAHIEPMEVESELPRIVNLTKAAGLDTPMVITAIKDARSQNIEAILATMQKLGIRFYRAAPPRYDYNAPFPPQYANFQRDLAAIAKLNEKYGVTAAWHTHSYANTIGGSGWDLWMLMKDLDPRYIGLNYDIGHITAKGGEGWRESVRAVGPYLHSVSVKDFYWEKVANVPAGQWPWRCRFVRPGEGMVDFSDFFRYLQSIQFSGPVENYFEYTVTVPGQTKPFDMLGTAYKKWKLTIPEESFIGYLKRDVGFYNGVWHTAMTTSPPPSFSVKAKDDAVAVACGPQRQR